MKEDFKVKLDILSDILQKKEHALRQILAITENQTTVLFSAAESDQWKTFISEMNVEKQRFINIVIECDDTFDKIFQEMGDEFEQLAPSFKKEVKRLQEQIKSVTDVDVRIRVCEEKNKTATNAVKPDQQTKIDVPKATKGYILKQYANNNKRP